MLETVLIVVHLLLALGLIGLVLLQHGKGADAGAAFGSGASSTVFGSRGSSNFLSRTTGILATLFFATSMSLAYFAMQTDGQTGIMGTDEVPEAAVEAEAPAAVTPQTGDIPVAPTLPEQPTDATGDVPAAPIEDAAPKTDATPAPPDAAVPPVDADDTVPAVEQAAEGAGDVPVAPPADGR